MWCPEGYVTFSEIFSQFLWDSDLVTTASGPPIESQRECINSFEIEGFGKWLVCRLLHLYRDDIRACLASGTVVRLSPSVFFFDMPVNSDDPYWPGSFPELTPFPKHHKGQKYLSEINFPYIDHARGLVLQKLGEGDRALDPIHGAALCIHESYLPVRLEQLTLWLIEKSFNRESVSSLSGAAKSNDIPERIVSAFNSGILKTKTDAKRMFGRHMKHEAWLAMWREAVDLKPELARPGPRPI